MFPDAKSLADVEVTDRDAWLGGRLAVDELAVIAVGAALRAAAALAEVRTGRRPHVALSAEHAALSFQSERHLRVGGRSGGGGFAPLSRMLRCAGDGWARTHGNYPHHAAALGRALGIDVQAGDAVAALESAAAAMPAEQLEQAVVSADGCAAALRSARQWAEHPAGQAAAAQPFIAWDDALAAHPPPLRPAHGSAARPADGLRVLDLTRVIAGPVGARTLAAVGADVLRVDSPRLPEFAVAHLDTGPGKRTATLDLADAERREALLAGADAVLIGYRPGALDRFDMRADQLAERHPHLVQVHLSAWGFSGPWSQRRGFDSLVQVASGVAVECAGEDGSPGVLPAQALDHATGHLAAAAALMGLTSRAAGEPIAPARLSLARTARALLDLPRPASAETPATRRADPDRYRVAFRDVELIAPPGTLDGTSLEWAHGPRPLGGDSPGWM